MMKILLAIENETDGKLICDFVANYRWPPGTNICVAHVTGSCADDYQAVRVRQSARDMLAGFAEQLSALVPGAELECQVVSGAPALEIIRLAEQWQANMIVMGQRNRVSYAQKTTAGSVSKVVAMEAPCSLAIIRPPQEAGQVPSNDELAATLN